MYPEIKIITGQKLSSDPMVIQLDVVINGIYMKGWFIAASDKYYFVHLSLAKYWNKWLMMYNSDRECVIRET